MTTVLNGSSVTYNRDGVTIDSYNAEGHNSGGSTTTIVRSAGRTVAAVHVVDVNNYACNLPSGAEVGDVVEIYFDATSGWVYAPSGETFLFNSASAFACVSAICRKLSSTVWSQLAS